MRLKAPFLMAGLALFMMAVPAWAHTESATLSLNQPTTIGKTQLQAGQYNLKVENNSDQMQVMREGKLVAQVPVKWVQLPKKSQDTEVDLTKNKITEVAFSGQTQAAEFPSD